MEGLEPSDLAKVTEAVAEAERSTSGEIVPVLARASDSYHDVALVWAAALGFTAMSLFAAFPQFFLDAIDALMGGWSHEWTLGQALSAALGLGTISFLGVWLALLWGRLRIALTPPPLKAARVREAAVRHFKVGAERRTHGRTGVLIYVSLDEHRAEIVADEPIAEKVAAEVWGEAMADMLVDIREGRLAEGIAEGVRDVGAVLAKHFPRAEDDLNELPDRLILV